MLADPFTKRSRSSCPSYKTNSRGPDFLPSAVLQNEPNCGNNIREAAGIVLQNELASSLDRSGPSQNGNHRLRLPYKTNSRGAGVRLVGDRSTYEQVAVSSHTEADSGLQNKLASARKGRLGLLQRNVSFSVHLYQRQWQLCLEVIDFNRQNWVKIYLRNTQVGTTIVETGRCFSASVRAPMFGECITHRDYGVHRFSDT